MRRMYSEKQILELVKSNPEAVIKALEGQDISVNAVIQKARYKYDFNLPNVTGMTKSQWYTKVVVIGNELHIIGNARYKNTSEETISFRLAVFTISNIPSNIGQFIIDENGDDLTKTPVTVEGASPSIRVGNINLFMGTNGYVHALRVLHSDPNQLQVYHNTPFNIASGNSVLLSFHISIELE